jgi:hypothetical protein
MAVTLHEKEGKRTRKSGKQKTKGKNKYLNKQVFAFIYYLIFNM